MGLGDAFRRLTGRGDSGELFSIPASGQIESTEPVSAAGNDAFDDKVREQMELAGLDPSTAEASAHAIEKALERTGMPLSATQVSVQGQVDGSTPFSVVTSGQGGATPARPAEDPLDTLARLADLRDKKVLTEAEFQAQKAKLLGEGSGGAGPSA